MWQISKNAWLSTIHTNHCLRGTTATAMHKSGYSLNDIAQVTCHKNIESLKYYLAQPTIDDMQKYSNSLFGYMANDDKENSDNVFENPPVPTKNVYKMVENDQNKKATTSDVVPYQANAYENTNSNNSNAQQNLGLAIPPTTTSNIMQLYRQNPVGMFVGATLNNCTININMPK